MINKKEPIGTSSLLVSLVALVIGIILVVGGESIYTLMGYGVSGILLLTGVVKFILYLFGRKSGKSTFSDCMSGILFIASGILIACFPKAIPITISVVIGALIIFSGINRLVLGFAVKAIDDKGSKLFIITSILMVLLGILILTQKFLNILGIFIVVYAVSEIIGYVYYTSQNKDYSEVLNKTVSKEIKEKEAKDAIIEEE